MGVILGLLNLCTAHRPRPDEWKLLCFIPPTVSPLLLTSSGSSKSLGHITEHVVLHGYRKYLKSQAEARLCTQDSRCAKAWGQAGKILGGEFLFL